MAKTKREVTEILVRELPNTHVLTPERAYSQWWVNQRESGGFRLTPLGYDTLKNVLTLDHYRVSMEAREVDTRLVMLMDRRLTMPYYLEVVKRKGIDIIFFGAKEATLAILSESVRMFIEGMADRR